LSGGEPAEQLAFDDHPADTTFALSRRKNGSSGMRASICVQLALPKVKLDAQCRRLRRWRRASVEDARL